VSFITFSFKSHMVFTIEHKLYTQALDSADDTIPIETRRILFPNRMQAFVSYGSAGSQLCVFTGIYKPRLAHDSQCQCRYRRAKLLCTIAKYDEAQANYREFANIMRETGKEISGEELKLKQDLDRRAAAGGDRGRMSSCVPLM
jgi:hypothetical protein